ncbi:D-Ala-D-Ala carboxypeptidase family metallohydrolase [Sandarakinorhabdus sp.]|uniref:D-Ala-D-Ala carboxypeptidase family metallohydrolase n=1 Tax=Sandarakinorhabdus sp. TaxID=1916663 RepID=UPI00286D7F3D|nr:D-Ala-D-Ala carboxypeptidase family metallohydrolase [Sandarakinorhabdus sp.]
MQLSRHFSLAEATASDTARAMGNPNQPTLPHLANLQSTAAQLELVRALFAAPIKVTSWYRNPAVNREVGGVVTSHHALGWAVDFRVQAVGGLAAARRIAASGIPFDQLIYYVPTDVVHLSFHPQRRGEVWTNPTTRAGAKLRKGLPT